MTHDFRPAFNRLARTMRWDANLRGANADSFTRWPVEFASEAKGVTVR